MVIPEGDIDKVESSIHFNFGIAGTNGTKYTLAITNASAQSAVQSGDEKSLFLNVSLRDGTNKELEIVNLNYSWEFTSEFTISAFK
jgi:hypothetical protein